MFYLEMIIITLILGEIQRGWEGFRWEDSYNNVKYYSSERNVNGQWIRYKIRMEGGKVSVKFSDDTGNTYDLIDPTDISTDTNAGSRKFRLTLEPQSTGSFSLDNFHITSSKDGVPLDNYSTLNEDFSSIPDFLENSKTY